MMTQEEQVDEVMVQPNLCGQASDYIIFKYTLLPKAEKMPAIIFRDYILTEAKLRSIWREK